VSYDLRFLVRTDQKPPPPDRVREYFRSRRWYEDQGGQLWYANEDTGVYFSFDVGAVDDMAPDPEEPPEPIDDGLVPAGLSFNLNYFRPHVFGLEAALELAAVAERFSLLVDDPQIRGMGRGAFTSAGFLGGWNAGNLAAHRALLSSAHDGHAPVAHHSLPAATLERIWRWNYDRLGLQEMVGDVFVPRISFLQRGGGLDTSVIWRDAIPLALPDVDVLVLVRDELAPRRWFRKQPDICRVAIAEAGPLLKHGRRVDGPSPYTLFDHVQLRTVDFFRRRASFAPQLEALPHDQVLTRELLDEAERLADGASAPPAGSGTI
jgi:hypothetical protein